MSNEPLALRLVVPSRDYLAGYVAALATGWSPDTTQDVHHEHLVSIRRDPDAFLADLLAQDGTIRHADGMVTPRLPHRSFWLWDGEFCGMIDLRFARGGEELPPYVKGHIGYAVVPWKQRRGYATAALKLILPMARAEGMRRVFLTCDDGNAASRKVIERNGGVLADTGSFPPTGTVGDGKRGYWIVLAD
jgi:predicted acetyltransferase